ncbi:MAG: TonB-dependent receptor [marine benthic group bacterium]|nr:TonB-dependent receptor [Gemmatimonadota bacterium]
MERRPVRSWLLVLPTLFFLLLLPDSGVAQEGAIAGTITDQVTGTGLSTVQVEVLRQDGSVMTGAFSSSRGAFRITGVPAGTYDITFTLPGWEIVSQERVVVRPGATTSVNAALSERSFNLNPITVTTSKRVEKALDAPAAVEVVSREDIAERPTVTPVDHVKEQAGVDFVSTGLQSSYVVVRGFNNVFSGATLNLTDFRISRVPSLRVNISYFNPTTNSDLDRVEVVLGPGSALYGPNAANGVIHFLTQSPIDDPGATIALSPGFRHQGENAPDNFESSTEFTGQAEGRVAWANDSRTFGIKASAQYFGGTDFFYNDPVEVGQRAIADACIEAGYNPTDPACFNFAGDLDIGSSEGQAELVTRVDNVADGRDYDMQRWGFDLRSDFRPNEETSIVLSGGRTQAINSVDLTGIGAGQVRDWGYSYVQGRFNWKRLFGQVFWNSNSNDQSYLLRSGRPLIDKSYQTVAQLQHGFDINDRNGLTYGVDFLYTNPQSEGTINGRHEDDDDVTEIGGYVQYDGRWSDKWNFVAAARLDDHSRLEDLIFSPRAAIVFKPTPERSIRASFNRAFSTPNTLNLFLDIAAQPVPISGPFFYDARAQGVTESGFQFSRDGNGVPQHMSPFAPLLGQSTRDFLPTTTAQLWQEAVAVVGAGDPQAGALLGGIQAPGASDIPVVAATLDLNSAQFINPTLDLAGIQDIPALEPTIWQTFEVGYKGLLLGNNLLLGANLYYTDVDNFVSALEPFTPNVFLPQEQTEAYLAEQFLPLVGVAFPDEATALGTAAVLAEQIGQLPLGSIAPTTAGGTTASPILLTYRNLGDFSYFGADASLTYIFNERWELGGTISWVEKDTFLTGDADDPATREVALNAPKWKGSLMVGYREPGGGLSGAFRGRYVDGFPVASGVYTGEVEAYTVFDLNAGYQFSDTGVGVQLDINNIFDNDYQSFVGVPNFGRYVMLRMIWSTDF